MLLHCILFAFLFATFHLPPLSYAQEPVVIPLADRLPDGRFIGYWLQVRAGGGEPSLVLLDTGSKGLMLRADRLGKQGVQHTGRKYRQIFQDGTVFEGELVKLSVQIGPVVTREPVFALSTNKIECSKQKPDCPAKTFASNSVAGIMGVGLGDVNSLENPLEFLPQGHANGFIIRGGSASRPASLTLGLTPANREGFTTYRMPKRSLTLSWRAAFMKYNAIPVCFSFDGAGIDRECGRVLFDTGSSMHQLNIKKNEKGDGGHSANMLRPGQTVTVTPEGMGGITLTSDGVPWAGLFKVGQHPDGVSILGGGAFKKIELLYDISGNAIGLKQTR
jgi:hypothetical protein